MVQHEVFSVLCGVVPHTIVHAVHCIVLSARKRVANANVVGTTVAIRLVSASTSYKVSAHMGADVISLMVKPI